MAPSSKPIQGLLVSPSLSLISALLPERKRGELNTCGVPRLKLIVRTLPLSVGHVPIDSSSIFIRSINYFFLFWRPLFFTLMDSMIVCLAFSFK